MVVFNSYDEMTRNLYCKIANLWSNLRSWYRVDDGKSTIESNQVSINWRIDYW